MQDFENLITTIGQVHETLRREASVSFNRLHTIHNWLIGMNIVEYEQNGSDRAKYGENLVRSLSDRLTDQGKKGMSATNLKLFRQFYRTYPQIIQTVSELSDVALIAPSIGQSATDQFHNNHKNQTVNVVLTTSESLIRHFSFTHFVELMRISDPRPLYSGIRRFPGTVPIQRVRPRNRAARPYTIVPAGTRQRVLF